MYVLKDLRHLLQTSCTMNIVLTSFCGQEMYRVILNHSPLFIVESGGKETIRQRILINYT